MQSFKTRSTDLIKNTKNQCVGVIPYSYGKLLTVAQFQTMFCLILQRKQVKLVGEPKVEIPRVRLCAVSSSFYT
ncbi:hypothetical protein DWQ65_01560 [Treponema phagedenis]|uniref:Uncharacterized protein n=1 Tax=Treponema phagedenis TaxID=162 RepID=A0AAE6M6Y1_TREPH|nr:hypothetical protein FUT79_01495 [Treponema phagedenis]QEJ97185.1 hypothetical protein FUT82_03740 [Treponema phagedenis]QEK01976.1 hypothetical protein FUT84_12920 [Treponema phagedenis]QEK02626.1 hypothetical protein FUT83_01600 [Treponema phagedenis]QEK07088.1 hypothetical protein FUT80_10400 [Treponema phagedenis]